MHVTKFYVVLLILSCVLLWGCDADESECTDGEDCGDADDSNDDDADDADDDDDDGDDGDDDDKDDDNNASDEEDDEDDADDTDETAGEPISSGCWLDLLGGVCITTYNLEYDRAENICDALDSRFTEEKCPEEDYIGQCIHTDMTTQEITDIWFYYTSHWSVDLLDGVGSRDTCENGGGWWNGL